jgi:hypothetical protein
MRHFAALLLSVCLASQVAAQLEQKQFSFKVEATFKGRPIPQSEIKLERIDTKKNAPSTVKLLPDKAKAEVDPTVRKRANPTASSANWCGAVNHATNANQIKLIHAYFQHPTCTKRSGQTYPQAAAQWAGIDGDSWGAALLQSGTVCKFDNATATVRNEAWWQWLPSGSFTINSLPVAPGDWFEVTIDTTTNRAGKITLSNISKGYAYTITISGGATLGRLDADWVVERPYYGSGLAGMPKFSDVWFQSAYATRVNGNLKEQIGIMGATQLQIPNLCASAEHDNDKEVSWSL